MPINVTATSFPGLVSDGARRFGPREALADDTLRLSYDELNKAMYASAAAAAAAGIGPGDRAAIWAPNSALWVVAALGVQARGAAVVPLSTRLRGEEAAFVIKQSDAKLLFTVRGFLDTDYPQLLRDADPGLADLPVVLLHGAAGPDDISWDDYVARDGTIDEEFVTDSIAGVTGDVVSDVMFTSGTTGAPKGVLTTHAQNIQGWTDYAGTLELSETDRTLIVLPFSHNFGFKAGFICSVMSGGCAVTLDVFSPERVMEIVQAEGITVLSGTPTLLQGVLDSPKRGDYDISTLRTGTIAGATVAVELVERLQSEHVLPRPMNGYGLSECAAGVALSEPNDDPETVAHWCGKIRPHHQVRIVDPDNNDVPLGDPGEILVKSPTVMNGYLEYPDSDAIDRDGWLHTGDIGLMNENGYLKITGRKKDMFIVGGFNAYPAEIELALVDHPDVADVAIVAVPDDRLGEVAAAFVVRSENSELTGESLIKWARERLANFKVPRYVYFIDQLPRNAMLKVEKNILRDKAASLSPPTAPVTSKTPEAPRV